MTEQKQYGGVDINDPERMVTQLAGCLVVAEGHDPHCREGDYGWSPALEAVKVLRRKYDFLRWELARVAETWGDQR